MQVKTHDAPTQTTRAPIFQDKDKSCQTKKKCDASTQIAPHNHPSGRTQDQSIETVQYAHCLIQDKCDDVKAKGLRITCIDWGGVTGSLLAATYGKIDEHGWCSEFGRINFWNLSAKNYDGKPFASIEHSSYLMSVAAHPERPSMFSAGSFNGEILLFDLNNDSQPLIACSKTNAFPINSLRWIFDANYGEWLILSMSADGYILLWTISNKLKFPIQGFNIRCNLNGEIHALSGTAMSSSARDIIVGSGAGVVSKIYVNSSIVFGRSTISEDGTKLRLKWSKNASRIISQVPSKLRDNMIKRIEKKAMEEKRRGVDIETVFNAGIPMKELFPIPKMMTANNQHIGPVTSVDYSYFNQDMYLTAGRDGMLKLHSSLTREILLTLEPSSKFPAEPICDAKFSKSKSTIVAFTSGEGTYIVDVKNKTPIKCPGPPAEGSDKTNKEPKMHCLAFNTRNRNLLACGDSNGMVHVWKLPSDMTQNRTGNDDKVLDELNDAIIS
uniref:Uncharacterized protein n=1 Tax=Leptocylindrus danicus TaxID=163516 RepID=A0A7S2LKP7_9STRA|mmetsp:Transcript_6918/g.10337  ORF Transcript_6918/g.10337 Transcript_6918/m.10337 type:complete len:497 (+) Transcript_6918:417-1907(+)